MKRTFVDLKLNNKIFKKQVRITLGFTLIELLAVIVILAIIALIATPIIMGIIEDSKKEALKDTAYGLINGATNTSILQLEQLPKTYTIENSAFVGNSLDMNGALPQEGAVIVNENGKVAIAINDGKWCARKGYNDSEVVITNDIDNCSIIAKTPLACFSYQAYGDYSEINYNLNNYGLLTYNNSKTSIFLSNSDPQEDDSIIITQYYGYEEDDYNNPACPKDVAIPKEIEGLPVKHIAAYTFQGDQITSVIIPNSIISIGTCAFANNQLTNVVIPNSVTSIGSHAFRSNILSSIVISNSVTTIKEHAF